jgi:CRP-like cAMP-binding protein
MNSNHRFRQYLRHVPLFADLDAKELDLVARTVTGLHFEPGSVLLHEGHLARDLLIAVEGTLEVQRDGEHVADVEAGGFVGELGLLTVVAKTPVDVLHVDGREFDALLHDVPHLATKMLPVIAARSAPAN